MQTSVFLALFEEWDGEKTEYRVGLGEFICLCKASEVEERLSVKETFFCIFAYHGGEYLFGKSCGNSVCVLALFASRCLDHRKKVFA